ncbi:MAG: DUF4281 domain-containing protein [Burkholderiaceae bacterium]|nr:DUF4281 domain-containing protein [Burkholderiaceae bacterium]
MNEALFSAASLAAMVGWLGLALAALAPPGRWRVALLAFGGRVVPVALCAAYAGLLVWHWGSAPGGGFSSLAAVMALFSVPGKMLGGWLHFLAFDLLVGHWLVAAVLASGRSRWVLLPVLPATFLYGPLGLLLYLPWRWAGGTERAGPVSLGGA